VVHIFHQRTLFYSLEISENDARAEAEAVSLLIGPKWAARGRQYFLHHRGHSQATYTTIEDCDVCCRPISLVVTCEPRTLRRQRNGMTRTWRVAARLQSAHE